jgi:hypothetical protein
LLATAPIVTDMSLPVQYKMAMICIDSIKERCIKDKSKKSNYKLYRSKGTSLTLNCLWCTCATITHFGISLPLHHRTFWLSNMHLCTKANFWSMKPHFTAPRCKRFIRLSHFIHGALQLNYFLSSPWRPSAVCLR